MGAQSVCLDSFALNTALSVVTCVVSSGMDWHSAIISFGRFDLCLV